MRYIITRGNGNPSIYELQDDGSYKAIAHGAGDSNFNAIAEMCHLANRLNSPNHNQAKINNLINEYKEALRTARMMINSTYGTDPVRHAYWRGVRAKTETVINNLKRL